MSVRHSRDSLRESLRLPKVKAAIGGTLSVPDPIVETESRAQRPRGTKPG